MPFETASPLPRRIAVIGGGISGMAAAHLLKDRHSVVLFEAERRLGGHARTIMAGKRGDQPVDTGFIVFNEANYPKLTRLFHELGVPTCPSNMSFGVSIDGGRLEYGVRNLQSVFAQRSNAARPAFLRMLRDILRFNKHAMEMARAPDLTVGAFLDRLGTGPWFRDYYLLPLSGAIWSTPPEDILEFPARTMVEFLDNHALLGLTGQHEWSTVVGGSIEYVRRLRSALERAGVDLRVGAPVRRVARTPDGACVTVAGSAPEHFDEVIFATHADDSLAMLADPSDIERQALGAVRYQPNRAILHADPAAMPKRRAVWSSWSYAEPAGRPAGHIGLTYWMNSLQPIPHDDPLFVTLNPTLRIDEALIHDETTFRHPVYDLATVAAQERIRSMNGTGNTWFCGAWMGHGFHEDGFASAVEVAGALQRRAMTAPLAAE